MKLDIMLPMTYRPTNGGVEYTIIAIGEHAGTKFYVCDICGFHPTAYLRIPKGMPLYALDYTECDDYIEVHGGFTYAAFGLKGVVNDDESWFIGWDYGHCCDFHGYYLCDPKSYLATHNKKWTTEEVVDECRTACEELAKLRECEKVPEAK